MVIGWQTVVMSKTQFNVNNLRISLDVKNNKLKSNGIQNESNNFTFLTLYDAFLNHCFNVFRLIFCQLLNHLIYNILTIFWCNYLGNVSNS